MPLLAGVEIFLDGVIWRAVPNVFPIFGLGLRLIGLNSSWEESDKLLRFKALVFKKQELKPLLIIFKSRKIFLTFLLFSTSLTFFGTGLGDRLSLLIFSLLATFQYLSDINESSSLDSSSDCVFLRVGAKISSRVCFERFGLLGRRFGFSFSFLVKDVRKRKVEELSLNLRVYLSKLNFSRKNFHNFLETKNYIILTKMCSDFSVLTSIWKFC